MDSGGLIGFVFLFLILFAVVFEWMRRETKPRFRDPHEDRRPIRSASSSRSPH